MAIPQTTMSEESWKDIFMLYPVFDNICAHLDPQDILALQRTTKQLAEYFKTLFKAHWNINHRLRRFVKDPVGFRSQMSRHGAIISGSFALQFFARTMWPDADLDLWIEGVSDEEENDELNSLGFYLQAHERYTKQRQPNDVDPYVNMFHHVYRVETYTREVKGQEEPRKIQLVYTDQNPLRCIISTFSHTAVLNVITWKAAYSIFPDLTFIKNKSYYMNNFNPGTPEPLLAEHTQIVTKYTQRGWQFVETVENDDEKSIGSLISSETTKDNHRHVGDSYSWKISLDMTGVEPGVPASVIDYSTFGLCKIPARGQPPNRTPSHYAPRVNILASCVLKRNYACNQQTPVWVGNYPDMISEDPPEDFWASIAGRLYDLTQAELSKLPVDERPDPTEADGRAITSATNIHLILGRVPVGWTFYDDKIPEWYEDYLKEKRRLEAEILQPPILNPGDVMSVGHNPADVFSAETALAAMQIVDTVPIAGGSSAE